MGTAPAASSGGFVQGPGPLGSGHEASWAEGYEAAKENLESVTKHENSPGPDLL